MLIYVPIVIITLGAHAQRGYGSWVCARGPTRVEISLKSEIKVTRKNGRVLPTTHAHSQ